MDSGKILDTDANPVLSSPSSRASSPALSRRQLLSLRLRRTNSAASVPQTDSAPTVSTPEIDVDSPTEADSRLVGQIFTTLETLKEQLAYLLVDDTPRDIEQEAEGEPLTAKRLKNNVSRFGRSTKPLWQTIDGIQEIISWKTPSYTMLIFLAYMYLLCSNWLVPMVLFLLIFRLFINYLQYRRRWSLDFHLIRITESGANSADSGVAEQVNFVLHVARKCQNYSGIIADNLEKCKNLLTWQCPKHTKTLFKALIFLFFVSIFFSTERLIFFAGFYLGIKIFIIDYIYKKFPRLQRRYDTVHRLWTSLPTDQQLGIYTTSREIERYMQPTEDDEPDLLQSPSNIFESLSNDDRQFCEMFSLPHTELPIPLFKGGKRCAIMEKGQSNLPTGFKHGKLYLTRSFLCFERSKEKGRNSKFNIVIPVAQIAKAEKAKPFSWFPGNGMCFEISIFGLEKPLLFAALMNRDELFDQILETCKSIGAGLQQSPPAKKAVDKNLLECINAALQSDSDSD